MCVFFLVYWDVLLFLSAPISPPPQRVKQSARTFPKLLETEASTHVVPGETTKTQKAQLAKQKVKLVLRTGTFYLLFLLAQAHTHTLASQARAHKHTVFRYRKRRLSSAHAHMGRWRTRALGGIERKRHRFPANEIEMFVVLVCCCFLFECFFFFTHFRTLQENAHALESNRFSDRECNAKFSLLQRG